MLIVRAPVRISLAGGGTDLAPYYNAHGGLVVSAAINHYIYAVFDVDGHSDIQIKSSDYQTFYQHRSETPLFWEGDLALPKAVIHHFGILRGVSLFIASEVPPGTGLGSSSALTVALVKGLSTLCGQRLTPAQVASTACYIELDKLGMPAGVQDQYASAFGGLNTLTMDREGVRVVPLGLPRATARQLESRLLLFFTQSSRSSSRILSDQMARTAREDTLVIGALDRLKSIARAVHEVLQAGDLDGLGHLLHESWEFKKQLSSRITNGTIDRYYHIARACGAIGGKITGAGGGGFLLLLSRPGCEEAITAALEAEGLYRMDYRLEASGAQVLVNSGLEVQPEMLEAA